MLLWMAVLAIAGQIAIQAWIDISAVDFLFARQPFRLFMRIASFRSKEELRYRLVTSTPFAFAWNILWAIPIASFMGAGGMITGIAGAFGNILYGLIVYTVFKKRWIEAFYVWEKTHHLMGAEQRIKDGIRKDIIKKAKKAGVELAEAELESIVTKEFNQSEDSKKARTIDFEREKAKREFLKEYKYQAK